MLVIQQVRLGTAVSKGRARAAWVVVIFALTFPGCTASLGSKHRALQREVGPATPHAPPTGGSFGSSVPTSAQSFGGNQATAGRPNLDLRRDGASLNRSALIRAVLEQNPTVRSAQFAFRAALAQYPQAISFDDPMLEYGITPGSFASSTIDDGHKIEFRQRIPFPGKLRLRGAEALSHAEAAKHDLQSIRLELAATASKLFDDFYYLARAIEINAEHVELLERFHAVSIARYEAGNGSQQDPLAAETELAHLIHQEVVLKTKIELTSMRINTLLRLPPTHPLPPPPTTLEPPSIPSDGADPEQVALDNRPELRGAAAHIEAEEASVAHARRDFLPDVSLIGAYNTLLPADENRAFVGFSIDVPLQLNRRRASLREAEAKLGQARAERDRASDEVRLAVAESRTRLHEAEHVLTLFRDALFPPAQDRVASARAGFETGQISFLEFIEADRNLRLTADGLEKARTERSQARTEFLRALGQYPAPIEEVFPK